MAGQLPREGWPRLRFTEEVTFELDLQAGWLAMLQALQSLYAAVFPPWTPGCLGPIAVLMVSAHGWSGGGRSTGFLRLLASVPGGWLCHDGGPATQGRMTGRRYRVVLKLPGQKGISPPRVREVCLSSSVLFSWGDGWMAMDLINW